MLTSIDAFSQASVTTLTWAGSSQPKYINKGFKDGSTYSTAKFKSQTGIALDPSGTRLFIADCTNNAIRMVNYLGNQSSSTTFSPYTSANGISHPRAVAVDAATNVYVLNAGNNKNGTLMVFNGFYYINYNLKTVIATNATHLTNAVGLSLDGFNNAYITVKSNTVIRVTPAGVSSVVGVITAPKTSLRGLAYLASGKLAIADAGNNGIWLMDPRNTNIFANAVQFTGFHGAADTNGPAAFAAFNGPETVIQAGNGILVVVDRLNNKVKTVDANGTVNRLFGVNKIYWSKVANLVTPGWDDGTVNPVESQDIMQSRLPYGLALAADGTLYDTETYYDLLRKATGTGLTSVQPGVPPMFNQPTGIALDSSGNNLYIADQANNAVQLLNLLNNQTTTFLTITNGVNQPASVLTDTNQSIFVLNQNAGTNGSVLQFDSFGNLLATNVTGLNKPTAFTMDGYGNMFIAEQAGNIRVFGSGVSNTIVTITNANVSLQGIAIFDDGAIAVSDAGNQVVWVVNAITKQYTRLTGQLGVSGTTLGSSNFAKLYLPHQLARAGGNQLVVADYGNNRLVTVTRAGSITNVLNSTNASVWFGQAGDPVPNTSSRFPVMIQPFGVAVGPGGTVYTSESYFNDIRGLTGTGLTQPPVGPFDVLPFFNLPAGIAYDPNGNNLFIADPSQNAVQLLNLQDNTTTTFLSALDGLSQPASVLVDTNEVIYVLNQNGGVNGFISAYDNFGNSLGNVASGLTQPNAFLQDGYGNFFVAEQGGSIRMFGTGVSNTIITITNAGVSLQGIALFDDGSIAVSDAGNQVIWSINALTKTYTRLTGQLGIPGTTLGSSNFAKLNQPHQLSRIANNQILVADYGNNRLVTVTRSGSITNVLKSSNADIWFGLPGDPVLSTGPQFVPMVQPSGVAVGDGYVFASEVFYDDIRGVLGTGISAASFNPGVPLPVFAQPAGIALNTVGNQLFITDTTNSTVRVLNLVNNTTTTFLTASNGIYQPVDVAVDGSDNLYVLNQGTGGNGSIYKFDKYGNLLATNAANLPFPTAMKLKFNGDLYVAELGGAVQWFSGVTSNTLATINTNGSVQLEGITILDNGSVVVSDAGNHVIWKIAPGASNAVVFTGILGTPGTTLGAFGFARLNTPLRLATALNGQLAIVDSGNNRVVIANDLGTITSVLNSTNANLWFGQAIDPVQPGSPNFVAMVSPVGIALSQSGTVYVSETVYKDIRGILNSGIYPLPPPPDAPINLVAIPSYGQVSLTWSTSLGATNYYVKSSESSGGPYTTIGTTSTTSYNDTTVINGTTYYYVVSAVNAGGEGFNSAEVSATPPVPPVPNPQIGYVTYPPPAGTSVFHAGSQAGLTFNNDADMDIVIIGATGSETFYTYSNTPVATSLPDPTASDNPTQSGYTDNLDRSIVQTKYRINHILPDLSIKAIGLQTNHPNSAVVSALFQFKVLNPDIYGANAAQFAVSNGTAGAQMWYTTDGSDPTNGNPSIGPITAGTTLSLNFPYGSTNLLFKICAFKNNYHASAIVTNLFLLDNYVPNVINFGFAYGPGSCQYIASPGQYYVVPIGLHLLTSVPPIYGLQFNVTLTNLNTSIVDPDSIYFYSLLGMPDGLNDGYYAHIQPYVFIGKSQPSNDPNAVQLPDGNWYQGLEFINTNNMDLLGVGWLEVLGRTNLYNTLSQNLLTYPLVDGTDPSTTPTQFVIGEYHFGIPTNATVGDIYQIQIGRPSATTFPGLSVNPYGIPVSIEAPAKTNLLGAGSENALKNITIGQLKYLVGDVYPANWYNAGDFGSSNLVNVDVMRVFDFAAYPIATPPPQSDLFDALDSCGNPGFLSSAGYYTNAAIYPFVADFTNAVINYSFTYDTNGALLDASSYTNDYYSTIYQTTYYMAVPSYITNINLATPPAVSTTNVTLTNTFIAVTQPYNALFDGNVNQIAFGDGVLDVCDVYVTFRRSLYTNNLVWFQRFWTNGVRAAVAKPAPVIQFGAHVATKPATAGIVQPKIGNNATSSVPPEVVFTAGNLKTSPGQTVQVPISANVTGSYPLRLLMLNLSVVPLNGAPILTTPIQFNQTAGVLGAPYTTDSIGNGNYSAVWLNSGNAGLTDSNTLGTLTITLPANASTNSAYGVFFDHASASPNGLGSFPKQTVTGTIWLNK